MSNNLRWICDNSNFDLENITKIESFFCIDFPRDYIEIVMRYNGGYPKPNRFYMNGNEEVFNNLLSFDLEACSNIVDTYNDVRDKLIENIIPFAEDPFGNLICFDYRNIRQPAVVFWEHEKACNDKELAITYLCNSFTELILMLQVSQE